MTRRWVPVAVLAASLTGVVAVGASALDDGLTYYQTPTEVVTDAPAAGAGAVRLSGVVVPGSVQTEGEESWLVLSDGATDVHVTYPGPVPAVLQEGEGAVVTGRLAPDGVLHASELVLRHSNEYRRAP